MRRRTVIEEISTFQSPVRRVSVEPKIGRLGTSIQNEVSPPLSNVDKIPMITTNWTDQLTGDIEKMSAVADVIKGFAGEHAKTA